MMQSGTAPRRAVPTPHYARTLAGASAELRSGWKAFCLGSVGFSLQKSFFSMLSVASGIVSQNDYFANEHPYCTNRCRSLWQKNTRYSTEVKPPIDACPAKTGVQAFPPFSSATLRSQPRNHGISGTRTAHCRNQGW